MIRRTLARLGTVTAAVAALAVLAYPVHASAGEPTTVSMRLEIRSDSLPGVAAALTPGGTLGGLVADVTTVDVPDADPSRCAATLSTPTAGAATTVQFADCAGSTVTGTVAVSTTSAEAKVSLDGVVSTGTGAVGVSTEPGTGTGIGPFIIIIIIIIIIILILIPKDAH